MTVGRKQDHSLVCLDIGQLLSLEVGWVVIKPSVFERTVGIAAEITVGRAKEDVATFVVANAQA